jgi:SAM-dependent methyltransferase
MDDALSAGEEWLRRNASLRMDANDASFPMDRRQFHVDRYQFAQRFCAERTVLDGACGTGYGSALLGLVAARVVGIDCAEDAVQYARGRYAASNVSFVRSFVEMTPFESDSFDVVASFETVEHTLCPEAHMMEIARLLEPRNGKAILSVPNRWGYTDHHFLNFDLGLLKHVTAKFFDDIELFYQNPPGHSTQKGIGPLVSDAPSQAQCIIAVCSGPRKGAIRSDRLEFVMDEIYRNAFDRHNEFRTLMYRQSTSFVRRVLNRLRSRRGQRS